MIEDGDWERGLEAIAAMMISSWAVHSENGPTARGEVWKQISAEVEVCPY